MSFDFTKIYTRHDGSYVINQGLYHVPNEGEWAGLWAQVDAYAKEHPEVVQPEPGEPEPTLEEIRTAKLSELNADFASVESSAWVISSLGFKADANTTANTNIDGLIKSMMALGTATVHFCDYDNGFHAVTLDDLKTLQLEVIQNGQRLYAQKWAMRDAINEATSKEGIEAIKIEFIMMDFSA